MASSKSSLFGSLFILLFSLPFAGVGVGALVWIWHDVTQSREALTTWTEVPARVEKADLEKRRGSKGSVTYLATGTFSYEIGGEKYQSSQLTFDSGADNIGDYQQNLHRELVAARQSGKPLTCRVNPENPAEAVLRPGWRPEMLLFKAMFAIMFGGAGFTLMASALGGAGLARIENRLRKRYPNEPWLWRKDWHSKTLRSGLGGGALASALFLVLANSATLPLWTVLAGEWSQGGAFPWVLTLVLLGDGAVSALFIHKILRWKKFRHSRLELEHSPVFLGGPLQARLFLPQALPPGSRISFKLFCEHKVVTGSGKHSKTTTTEVWGHEQTVDGPVLPGEPAAFACELPGDQPSTDLEDSRDSHTWILTAKADIPGVDLDVRFELPVFNAPGDQ